MCEERASVFGLSVVSCVLSSSFEVLANKVQLFGALIDLNRKPKQVKLPCVPFPNFALNQKLLQTFEDDIRVALSLT